MNQLPDKLIGFKVYSAAEDLIGVADVELPTMTAVSEGMQGAGIAGEIDTPAFGQFSGMQIGLTFRTISGDAVALLAPKVQSLDIRGAIQSHDAGNSKLLTIPVKILVKTLPKEMNLGRLAMGVKTDTVNNFEVMYIKVWVGDQEILELDKLNYIFRVNGEDYFADTRVALGM